MQDSLLSHSPLPLLAGSPGSSSAFAKKTVPFSALTARLPSTAIGQVTPLLNVWLDEEPFSERSRICTSLEERRQSQIRQLPVVQGPDIEVEGKVPSMPQARNRLAKLNQSVM